MLTESHHIEFNQATYEFTASQLEYYCALTPGASTGDLAKQKAKASRRQRRALLRCLGFFFKRTLLLERDSDL